MDRPPTIAELAATVERDTAGSPGWYPIGTFSAHDMQPREVLLPSPPLLRPPTIDMHRHHDRVITLMPHLYTDGMRECIRWTYTGPVDLTEDPRA